MHSRRHSRRPARRGRPSHGQAGRWREPPLSPGATCVTEGAGSPVLRRARLPHLQVTGSNGGSRGPDWRRIAYLAGSRACSSGNGSRRLAQPSAVQLVGFHQPSKCSRAVRLCCSAPCSRLLQLAQPALAVVAGQLTQAHSLRSLTSPSFCSSHLDATRADAFRLPALTSPP